MAVSIQTILKSSLPKGDPGFSGSTGFTGSRGDPGFTGSIGYTGSQGGTLFDYSVVGSAYRVTGLTGDFPIINLLRGQLYYFDFSNVPSSDPLALRLETGSTAVVPGTEGNDPVSGTNGNLVVYRVPLDAPDFIVYQGTANPSWVGLINIFDQVGYTGSAGFTGSFGFTGSRGEQGYTGSAGLDGYTGSRGDDGTSVKIVGVVATANDLPDPYNGDFGDGYIVTDTGNLWTWSGSAWVEVGRILGYTGSQGPAGGYTGSKGEPGVAASFTTRAYTGDGSTTEFAITEGNTIQTVMVFLNGVNQRPTDDYTVAGSTLTFATAPVAGELIIVREMPQAATGYTGSQGETGFTGSQGIPGEAAAIGYTGSAGFTGSEGYTGSKGEQGTPGSSVTIVASVDNATLLPLSYSGSIGDGYITRDDGHLHVWDGTEWDDVGQIVGYTGSRGTDGFVGSRGDTGYTGSTGFTGSAGQGLDPWTKISANYSASTGNRLIADTSGGSFTVTLPLNPAVGDYIQITDAGDFFLTPLIIDPNGEDIEGAPDNISVDIPGITIELIYDGVQWQITSTTGPQGEPGYTGSAGIGLDSITLLQSGNLTVLAGTVRWYAPYDLEVISIKTRLKTAADGTVSIAINKNDQLAVNLSISANSTAGTEYTTPLSLLEDDYLTVDVTTIGSSSAPGVDLYVSFKYQPV
jgi:hypothetical protein